MQISPETKKKLKVFLQEHEAMGRPSVVWEKGLPRRLKLVVAEELLKRLEKHITVRERRILDVGSGMGDFLLACFKHGLVCYGIEPNHDHLDFSKSWFRDNKAEIHLCVGIGEKIPFHANTFDIISCLSVLEHVDNPAAVLREGVRVLKPGGIFYINSPNYIFPFEPHYLVFWPPFLPKRFAKIYLKLLKKPTSFIEHINYINFPSLLRIIRKAGLRVRANWINDVVSNPSLVKSKRQRVAIRVLRFLHMPKLVFYLVSPSITLILQKSE